MKETNPSPTYIIGMIVIAGIWGVMILYAAGFVAHVMFGIAHAGWEDAGHLWKFLVNHH